MNEEESNKMSEENKPFSEEKIDKTSNASLDNKQENKKESSNISSSFKIGFLILIVAFISSFIGGVIATFAVPALSGLDPMKMLRGEYIINDDVSSRIQPLKKTPTKPGKENDNPVIKVSSKIQPSVVNIRTEQKGSLELFEGHPETEGVEGVGSGVIYREDGYILTNNHVVQDADKIYVTIGDNDDVSGRVIGRDADTDIAVIKVNLDNLPVPEFGDPSQLEVGELTVAIGSPFTLEHTVTSGIISALNRNITDAQSGTTLTDLIQTDAAINPGNSGGALCNAAGQIIGINTLIISTTMGNQGVGFAIPVDLAINVADQLIKTGEVSHPFVGISGRTVDKSLAEQLELKIQKGAYVVTVLKDTPASKAGIKKNDVIIKFDKTEVESMEELISFIRRKKVGQKVEVVINRDGKIIKLSLVLSEKPKTLPD